MSTFRIERIDQGLPDEWIPRLNDDGLQIGDDVVAEDVNELSEGILATQTELLKSSIYTPGTLLDPTEGIAARLKYLEETAGQATLQDVYENGNIISVNSGAPLLLGGGGEITLDDIGNLTFSPTTMRVKGLGASYLGFTPNSVTTYLSDLNIGANSAGYDLTLTSGQEISFHDSNLSTPINLSEFGQTDLATTSQTIIGAINELKNGTFNTTLQSVYDQSSSGRIVTSSSVGPFRVENGTGNPLLPAINCIGKLIVSESAEVETLQVGTDTSISDANGIETTHKIKTTDRVETPRVENLGTLTFQDNRISLTLSELGVTSLDTSSQSIGGAINELKQSVDSVGGGVSLFGNQHSLVNGMHEIITTQASIGQDSTKRIIVRNSSSTETFSVNALGEMIAQKLNLAGVAIEDAIDDLLIHMNGDGTDHSALSSHLAASNPHNTVKTVNALSGGVNIVSGAGITVGQNGQNIVISSSITGIDLQAVYDSSSLGEIQLDTSGGKNLLFRNSGSDILVQFSDAALTSKRNIVFDTISPQLQSTTSLDIVIDQSLNISSTNSGVNISTGNLANPVNIQGVDFSDAISTALDNQLPQTVIGAINKIQNASIAEFQNPFTFQITRGMPVTFAYSDVSQSQSIMLRPIADYHPMNDWYNYFGQKLNSNIFIALDNINPGDSGKFTKFGIVDAEVVHPGASFDQDWRGSQAFLMPQAFGEIAIQDVSLIADGDTFTLDVGGANKVFTASTTLSDHPNGVFRVFTAGSPEQNTQETIGEIAEAINHRAYTRGTGTPAEVVAMYDGATTRGKAIISDNSLVTNGDIFQITIPSPGRYNTVQLTAVASSAGMIATDFLIGDTEYETAQHLANAINRTTRRYCPTTVVQEDLYGHDTMASMDNLNGYTTTGHGFVAKVVGTTIYLEREYPDFAGNSVTLLSGTAGITTLNPDGGFIKVKYYCQDRTKNTMIATQSNASGLIASSATYITLHEYDYLIESDYQTELERLFKWNKPIKIGEIVDVNSTTAQVFIDVD